MRIEVVTGEGRQLDDPFLVRLGGWTEERYFCEAPEDRLWEFQDGDLIVHSPAKPGHQRVVRFLTILLSTFVEERGLGEVFNGPAVLRLRPGANKEPDIFFLRTDHRDHVGPDWIEGPADFVIEVISSGTRSYDLVEKAQVYRESGVVEYWAIDRERHELTVHRQGQPDFSVSVLSAGRLESTAVPGFWVEVTWLWQEPLPSAPACLRQVLKR